ncbi:hypothetical protein TNCV_3302171 [Trichonephila clavipes]|nr:hypothetical protein TNCV_3302171 [Trichonephila clavipes]
MVHDGVRVHFCAPERDWPDLAYSGRCKGRRRGPFLWPPQSPDLTLLDIFPIEPSQGVGALKRKDCTNCLSARFLYFDGHRTVTMTATGGSDVVQSGRPIFDDFFQHLWPYIGNNTANVVFQMVKRLWLIRIDL